MIHFYYLKKFASITSAEHTTSYFSYILDNISKPVGYKITGVDNLDFQTNPNDTNIFVCSAPVRYLHRISKNMRVNTINRLLNRDDIIVVLDQSGEPVADEYILNEVGNLPTLVGSVLDINKHNICPTTLIHGPGMLLFYSLFNKTTLNLPRCKLHAKKTNDVLCKIGKAKDYRLFALGTLLAHGIDVLYSMIAPEYFSYNIDEHGDVYDAREKQQYIAKLEAYIEKFGLLEPTFIDDMTEMSNTPHYSDQTADLYNSTKLSLVLEGTASNYSLLYTEKTAKALLYGHPFVIFGDYGINRGLIDLGFKLYSDYQLDDAHNMRIVRINSVVNSINDILSRYKTDRSKFKEIADYNANYLKSNEFVQHAMSMYVQSIEKHILEKGKQHG